MKCFVIFVVFFLLFVNLSHQLPKLVNCNSDHPSARSMTDSCGVFTCNGPDDIKGLGCPEYRCANQMGYNQPDNSKPYPECCGGPICSES